MGYLSGACALVAIGLIVAKKYRAAMVAFSLAGLLGFAEMMRSS